MIVVHLQLRERCIEEIRAFHDNSYCTKRLKKHGCILRIGYHIKTRCPLIFMNVAQLEMEHVHEQSPPEKVKLQSSSRFSKLYLTKLIKLIMKTVIVTFVRLWKCIYIVWSIVSVYFLCKSCKFGQYTKIASLPFANPGSLGKKETPNLHFSEDKQIHPPPPVMLSFVYTDFFLTCA